jgi:hypothetical protein
VAQRLRHFKQIGKDALRALAALLMLAAQAHAQGEHSPAAGEKLPASQCRYSAEGRLTFSPRGISCPAFAAPPAAIDLDSELAPRPPAPAPAAPPAKAAPPPAKAAAQPALAVISRGEVSALLAEREKLDAELGRIREALAFEDRESARRVVDESLARIARHLEHEARLLQPLAAAGGR